MPKEIKALLARDRARAKTPLQIRASGEAVEILLYDEIGAWGVTAADFAGALQQVKGKSLLIRLNSPGGDVFDGLAIYNALRQHDAPVNCQIDGLAASAASIVMLAGKRVTAAPSSFVMVHNPWSICMGDAATMREMATTLDKISGSMAQIYQGRTQQDAAAVKKWMDDETWFTADEAKVAGLVDDVSSDSNSASALAFDLGEFRNAPAALKARMAEEWKAGGSSDLPIDSSDAWDGAAAASRILEAAGFDGDTPDSARARRGFLVYDAGNPHLRTSYKLPFADFIGGELKAVAGGIRAAASRLPDTQIPADVKAEARKILDGYEAKLGGGGGPDSPDAAMRSRRLAIRRLRQSAAA